MRMMYKKMIIGLSLAATVFSVSAQNLISMPVSVRLDSRPGVKYIADKTANTQKMLVEKYSQDKDGNLCIVATLYFGGEKEDKERGCGVIAAPDSAYIISFEYQGDVPRFWMGVNEFTGSNFWKDRKRLKAACLTPKKEEWKKYQCEVITGKQCKRIGFYVTLYVNEKDEIVDMKPGQSLAVRNVSIIKK